MTHTSVCLDCQVIRPLAELRPIDPHGLPPALRDLAESDRVCRDREDCLRRRVARVKRDEY